MATDKIIFNRQCDEIDEIFSQLTLQGITVTDGVINREKYYDAKPRLMWILKEANSEESWNYANAFNSSEWLKRCHCMPSIRRVMYTSYGILKSAGKPWSGFPWSDEIECQSALQEIAFVNIKKTPGGSVAYPNEIKKAYRVNRRLLKLQIETYNPDVVIFGNTMNFVETSDFNGLESAVKRISKYNNHYYFAGDRLYINAYHPSYLKLTDRDFVMDIVGIYQEWAKIRK